MEAAVASGILKIVGNKLAPLIMMEYSSIVGAKKDLQELQDQVEEINSWLESVGDKAVGNDQSFNWLKKLKNIAYEVDDIVDEFQLKAEKHENSGIVSTYLWNKPKSIIFQCKVATKIKAIKNKFSAIVKQRKDFSGITSSLPTGHPVHHVNMTVGEMPLLPNIDATSILGREKDKDELISKLVEVKDQQTINIVSIIGLGGSGKTTLAKLVYNDGNIIDKHFEVKLWVYVSSQEFDVVKIIGKLFESIAGEKSEQYPLQRMSEKISDKLTQKRYLLVLDDVWTKDQILWDQFMVHLKHGTPGSAILLTMRSSDVAGTVRSTYQFSLPFLSLGDSWQLFEQSFGMPVKHLEDSEFVDVGKEILNKCGGVPLAIKVIASILRGKELIGQWQAIRDSNLLSVEGEEASVSVSACLMLSYFHLPSHMKQCFTVCSIFPKGYMIDKEQLIDQWIAHDMIIPEAGVECLEYTGHKYFNSLVQISFLQDVAEDRYGRVECRMHDLVHDLALSILDDKISLVVPKEATSSAKSCRYFSLIKQPENLAPKNIFRKARAVYMLCSGDYPNVMALEHAKHLRSVMVGYVNGKKVNIIFQVKYLKYLAMSPVCETLPKGFSDVWSLQALHVTQSHSLLELPKSIGKLKMLRTLNLSGCQKLKCLPDSIGDCEMISSIDLCNCKNLKMLPGSIGNLRKLRTLNLSRCEEITVLPDSIGRNEKLRVLRLSFTKIKRLPSDITTLKNLESLDLQFCWELVELPKGIGKLEKLQVLNLNGCKKFGGMPLGIGQLCLLQNLGLFIVGKGEKFAGISELSNVSRIEELTIRGLSNVLDPNDANMACLKHKKNLQRLNLYWTSKNMEEVNTELQQDVLDGLEPPHRMKELEIHGYSGRHYARWMQNQVGGGVPGPAPFPFLRVMKLCDFPYLKHLHGLVELPCLEELELNRLSSLESISGGPFPSLVWLEMTRLPCLGEVWMVTMPDEEGGCCYSFTPQLGQVWVGNCLTELRISYCPKLEVKPHIPLSLQHFRCLGNEQLLQSPGQSQGSSPPPNFNQLKKLELEDVTGLGSGHGWELLQHMTALESLQISFFHGVETELPESLWSLTSLRSLQVSSWYNIRMLPEPIGELRSLQELTIQYCNILSSLPQSIGQLTFLQELVIEQCKALRQLPDCLGELCSLRKLEIKDLAKRMTRLPRSICRLTTSLQDLKIYGCPGLKSLPQGIEGLASLEKLSIMNCTGLTSLPQGLEGLASLEKLSIMNCTSLTSLPQGIKGLVFLEELIVSDCPRIQAFPEGIKGLTTLKELQIWRCPDLQRRCERGTGEDWHLISHIPDVWGLDG